MSLKSMAKALRSKNADGGPLIDHIVADALLPASEAAYVVKYFDTDVRKKIWTGSTVVGGFVQLSVATQNLKSAFQNRFFTTGQFPPMTAYHATKAPNVATMIVAGGFNSAGQTLYGDGCYFFSAKAPATAYSIAGGANGNVLEVTVFGAIVVQNPPALGGDAVVLQTTLVKNIFLVKNGLVIFPKVVH